MSRVSWQAKYHITVTHQDLCQWANDRTPIVVPPILRRRVCRDTDLPREQPAYPRVESSPLRTLECLKLLNFSGSPLPRIFLYVGLCVKPGVQFVKCVHRLLHAVELSLQFCLSPASYVTFVQEPCPFNGFVCLHGRNGTLETASYAGPP